MARRSELMALNWRDVSFHKDGTGVALIARSKTDKFGEGVELFLSRRTCEALKRYKDSVKYCVRTSGVSPVFHSMNRGGRPLGRLDKQVVARVYKELAILGGLKESEAKKVSGHSCRVGFAQDLVEAGFELPSIMQAGRWSSPEMPARYASKVAPKRNAAAKFYEGRG